MNIDHAICFSTMQSSLDPTSPYRLRIDRSKIPAPKELPGVRDIDRADIQARHDRSQIYPEKMRWVERMPVSAERGDEKGSFALLDTSDEEQRDAGAGGEAARLSALAEKEISDVELFKELLRYTPYVKKAAMAMMVAQVRNVSEDKKGTFFMRRV